jgi:hypothetical protein
VWLADEVPARPGSSARSRKRLEFCGRDDNRRQQPSHCSVGGVVLAAQVDSGEEMLLGQLATNNFDIEQP